jgi:hypothetical protein
MDWLTFFSSLIGSLAWPATVGMVVIIFRSQVSSLIKSVSRLKWREVEAEFGEMVEQIREDVRQIENNPNYRDEPVDPKLVNLLEAHPHLAVIEGYKTLEKAIVDLSVSKLQTDRKLLLYDHLNALMKAKILTLSMNNALKEIWEVRDRAIHETDFTISKGQAYVFLDSISDMIGLLNKLA